MNIAEKDHQEKVTKIIENLFPVSRPFKPTAFIKNDSLFVYLVDKSLREERVNENITLLFENHPEKESEKVFAGVVIHGLEGLISKGEHDDNDE